MEPGRVLRDRYVIEQRLGYGGKGTCSGRWTVIRNLSAIAALCALKITMIVQNRATTCVASCNARKC